MSPRRSAKQNTRLTPKQLAVLTFLRDYDREHGYAPTLQEVAEHFDVTKVTIFEHVGVLQHKGYLERLPHKARSVTLTDQAAFPDERSTRVPMLGRIAAGSPIEAIEDTETLDFEEMLHTRGQRFALLVSGDSMIEEQIRDGDYVIVERRNTARNGETVVALLDSGEATLKKFYRERGRIRLQPANSSMKPIYVDDVRIQGIVIGVLRRY